MKDFQGYGYHGKFLEVDLSQGQIRNLTKGLTFNAKPYPDFMAGLIEAGGLIEYTRKRLDSRRIKSAV